MAWFRKPRSLDLGTFVQPEALPEASIDDLVAESELLVGAAVRLAVKNLLILRSVRDGLDYDEQLYLAAARDELLVLAEEKRGDAERTAEARADALTRSGRAQHFHDYGERDIAILERREAYDWRLAERLVELAGDRDYAAEMVAAARDAAWHEIAESVRAKLERAAVSSDDRDYHLDRQWRLEELTRDLERQLAESPAAKDDQSGR